MLAYIHDHKLKRETNKQGKNYWEAYVEEILGLIGASALPISLDELCDSKKLSGIKTLIIGSQSGKCIDTAMCGILNAWVKGGGILLGFAPEGLDEVFGIEYQSDICQAPDDYSISGFFELWPHDLTKEIHPILFKEQKLVIVSDIKKVSSKECVELARLYDREGKDLNAPAVTWRRLGSGYAGYFAFDVPKTVWLLHQGRPLPEEPGDQLHFKTSLLSILGSNSKKVPYADEIALLIQNMIAQNLQPLIYQIPPEHGRIPDALFYWSGDEYFGPVEQSLFSSDWMKEKGLPYHINMGVERNRGMKDGHPVSKDEMQHIFDNGHEISLWYNILHEKGKFVIAEEDIKYQNELFYEKYGYPPVCTLMNSTNWWGWAEPARWMAKYGGKADNTYNGIGQSGDHPLFNSSFFAFGFGTSYPFYFYEDYRFENKRIDFIEEPITCYELGHRGSVPPYEDKDSFMLEDIHLPIDMAARYHFTMNFFYHPYYIVNYPRCREAIEEILRYIAYNKYDIIHMGSDRLCSWWNARSQSSVNSVVKKGGCISIKADCAYPSGMIIKLIIPEGKCIEDSCTEYPVFSEEKKEFGANWLFMVVPEGKHEFELALVNRSSF